MVYERIWLPKLISGFDASSLFNASRRFSSSSSYSCERKTFIAHSRFLCWLRSFWHWTTVFVGKWVMRTADSTLLTFWPPWPPARNVSMRRSSGLMLISMRSSISGITNADANDVCRRAAWSNGEIRTSRCTPVSPASNPYAFSPANWMVAFLMPASSPGVSSSTSAFMFLRSAQRKYIRNRMDAQSCDSVPPAPGLMVMMAFRWSVSPESSVLVSSSPMYVSALSISRDKSFSNSLRCSALVSSFARLMYVSMSSEKEVSFSSAAICSSVRLRSRKTACASSWLLQKFGSAARASRLFRRSRYCGASKITPNQGDAGFQSFVAILQIFENHFISARSLVLLSGKNRETEITREFNVQLARKSCRRQRRLQNHHGSFYYGYRNILTSAVLAHKCPKKKHSGNGH